MSSSSKDRNEESRIPFMSNPQQQPPVNVEEEIDDDDPAYSVDHLSAVVRPVGLTMILAS